MLPSIPCCSWCTDVLGTLLGLALEGTRADQAASTLVNTGREPDGTGLERRQQLDHQL